MKKLLSIVLLLSFMSNLHAQTVKEEMYDKIESSYAWINKAMLDNSATINMTDAQWELAKKNDMVGISVFNALGGDIAEYLDLVYGTKLVSECSKENAKCADEVAAKKGTISIEFNAKEMKPYPEYFKIAAYALSAVGQFIGDNTLSTTNGVKAGWRPKGKTLKIILNINNSKGMPTVSWNTDSTIATITMPVAEETGGWVDQLHKGLQKGGSK